MSPKLTALRRDFIAKQALTLVGKAEGVIYFICIISPEMKVGYRRNWLRHQNFEIIHHATA